MGATFFPTVVTFLFNSLKLKFDLITINGKDNINKMLTASAIITKLHLLGRKGFCTVALTVQDPIK